MSMGTSAPILLEKQRLPGGPTSCFEHPTLDTSSCMASNVFCNPRNIHTFCWQHMGLGHQVHAGQLTRPVTSFHFISSAAMQHLLTDLAIDIVPP